MGYKETVVENIFNLMMKLVGKYIGQHLPFIWFFKRNLVFVCAWHTHFYTVKVLNSAPRYKSCELRCKINT